MYGVTVFKDSEPVVEYHIEMGILIYVLILT